MQGAKMADRLINTSGKDDWATPAPILAYAEKQVHRFGYRGFNLDAAAKASTAVCPAWYGPDHPHEGRRDALAVDWGEAVVWCNPPYSRAAGGLLRWCAKFDEASRLGALVVALFFCRTETRAWHRHVVNAAEVHLFEGRIRFIDPATGEPGAASAPAPSCLVIWEPRPSKAGDLAAYWNRGEAALRPRFVHVPRSEVTP